jgi:hypothetical protein
MLILIGGMLILIMENTEAQIKGDLGISQIGGLGFGKPVPAV